MHIWIEASPVMHHFGIGKRSFTPIAYGSPTPMVPGRRIDPAPRLVEAVELRRPSVLAHVGRDVRIAFRELVSFRSRTAR
jgi:hypothetical protein